MLSVDVRKRRDAFDLDLRVDAPAGAVALFGPSGCGKSTLVDMIAGLVRPDRGRICVGDTVFFDSEQRIDEPPERRRVGYVFQDGRLFPHYTVLGNLRYGARRAPKGGRSIDFERVVGLLGLEPLLVRKPARLSGGERQRVAIGRALLSQPRLLLLDEPLASLDAARRDEVLPYLERLRDELSIPMVYVSHQFEEVVRIANHVVLMHGGRCVAQGDVCAVSLRPELRALIGTEAVGAVVDGRVVDVEASSGLARVSLGDGEIRIDDPGLAPGQAVRLQLLARDLIVALEPHEGLSVRNRLAGVVVGVITETDRAALIDVDAGGVRLLARVTTAAVRELALRPGIAVWLLVKTATLRGHAYPR